MSGGKNYGYKDKESYRIGAFEASNLTQTEIGHYKTTAGNILDLTTIANIKQKLDARIWASEKVISFKDA